MKKIYRICSLGFAGMLLAFSCYAQTTYYVKANASGSNNGSSWVNAFKDLQSALEKATNGDNIWVAAGTYKPSKDESGNSSPADVRKKVFVLKNGVKLYGGFAGTETSLAQRNIPMNGTILSGDLSGNDQDGFINMSDNTYHVIGVNTPDAPTVLDGVIIKGGNADNSNFNDLFLGQNFGFLYGGGIFTVGGSDFTLSNCVITGNSAYHGGGMLNRNTAPKIINCVFTKNNAVRAGGAIFFENLINAIPTISNTVIESNTAAQLGGAIFNRYSNPVIINTTIVNNTVPSNGGTIYNENPSNPVIKNSIIYKNTGGLPIINDGSSVATITYTDIEANYIGTGNTGNDPIFNKLSDADGADNIWRTADDGLHLRTISPAANTANNSDAAGLLYDITGADRIQNTTVNMGAYETLKPVLTYYVKQNAGGANNGTSWTNAFTSLQSALEASENGDQIWVAEGTWLPSKDQTGNTTPTDARKKSFILKNGVKLYGGFAGTESSLAERNFTSHQTILSGDLNHDDQDGFTNMSDNCYHVIAVDHPDSPTTLDGVTVSGGNADNFTFEEIFLGEYFGYLYGGGIFTIYGSNFTLANCVVTGNVAYHGGGMLNRGTAPAVINCVFTKNKATRAGGAIFFENSLSAVPVVTNTVIEQNSASEMAGGIFNRYSNTLIVNSTIVNNTATSNNGTAMYNESPSSVVVDNSIIWGHTGTVIVNDGSASVNINYSDVQGGAAGTGNLNQDPLFVNSNDANGHDDLWMTTDDGYALLSTSSAADKGLNAAITAGITTDIVGDARILNSKVNMGAYERVKQLVTLSITNTNGVYNTSLHNVTVTTNPQGIANQVFYTQGIVTKQPINAGDYDVLAVITDKDFTGYAVSTLHIAKADQSVTFNALEAGMIGDVVELNATATSQLDIAYTSSDESIAHVDGNHVTLLAEGTVVITATQPGDINYNASSQQQSLTVNKKTQTISFDVLTERIFGEKPFPLQATTTSGLTITYESSNTLVATVDGNVVTLTGSGETTITAHQDGNDVFAAAEPASQNLIVKMVTGVETSHGKGISIYPVPAHDHIVIQGIDMNSKQTITLNDNSGRSIQADISITDDDALQLNLSNLPEGIYFLRIETRKGIETTKVVKN